MAAKSIIPEQFGPLQGVRIISTGTLIAQPFAGQLAAEMGAEVIQVERPGGGDAGWRTLGISLPALDGSAPVADELDSGTAQRALCVARYVKAERP
jgi:crotonobetainyl-CoA:carnitine CoA-transferase CaiB-like acyl-CoA transferase